MVSLPDHAPHPAVDRMVLCASRTLLTRQRRPLSAPQLSIGQGGVQETLEASRSTTWPWWFFSGKGVFKAARAKISGTKSASMISTICTWPLAEVQLWAAGKQPGMMKVTSSLKVDFLCGRYREGSEQGWLYQVTDPLTRARCPRREVDRCIFAPRPVVWARI